MRNSIEGLALREKTRALCHAFYRGFVQDPDLFMDMSRFAPYRYDPVKVDAYFDRERQRTDKRGFYILLGEDVIGEVGFKHISPSEACCEMEICLQNDKVKNQGYGTAAERLALAYAFSEMGMETVLADCVLKNLRSQHVLEKLGFQLVRQDGTFRYYQLTRDRYHAMSGRGAPPEKGREA